MHVSLGEMREQIRVTADDGARIVIFVYQILGNIHVATKASPRWCLRKRLRLMKCGATSCSVGSPLGDKDSVSSSSRTFKKLMRFKVTDYNVDPIRREETTNPSVGQVFTVAGKAKIFGGRTYFPTMTDGEDFM